MSGGPEAVRAAIERGAVRQFPDPARKGRSPGGSIDLELARLDRNDLGNARRLFARHGHDLIYVTNVGWHVWDGQRWSPDGNRRPRVVERAQETADSILEEAAAVKDDDSGDYGGTALRRQLAEDLFKWSKASGDVKRIAGMISMAEPKMTTTHEALDRDLFLINLENGTLPLIGACDALRPPAREDLVTKLMPVAYDPEATCPRFDAFLKEVLPNPEVRLFLQVWSGYCLTGSIREHKVVFNWGVGRNGKSTFVDLIARILGPYSATLPFASFMGGGNERGSDATPDLARLPGKRLVRMSEPKKGKGFDEEKIKALTGGEEVTARNLYQEPTGFFPQFKLMMSGNHKPPIRGTDVGIWARFLLVHWGVIIPESRQDKNLGIKLWEERSGVLNWLLDGVRIWLERGLVIPPAVKATTDEYREASDPLGRFLADCVFDAVGEWVSAEDLYNAYKRWCLANEQRPWSKKGLGMALNDRPDRVFRRGKDTRGNTTYLDILLDNVPSVDLTEPPEGEGDYIGT